MLRKKLLVGAVSLCAVVALLACENVIKSKADSSVQLTESTEITETEEVVVNEVETPKFWRKYNTEDATYKVTLPLSNGMGNVSYVTPLSKEITEVEIPKEVTINGIVYQVTTIEKGAFDGCSKLKKVTIGKEVKKIEKKAFANLPKLKKVSIGSKVKKIEKEAFKNCPNLKEIDVPNKTKSIGTEAFAKCDSLKKVEIGSSVKTIGKKAFYDCGNLKKVKIGKSVKTISKEAFCQCNQLKEIRIKGDSLAKIGKDAFKGIRTDAEFKIDSADYDRIAALFTAEVGYEPTMILEIKKGLLETLQEWFSEPEDAEDVEENVQEVGQQVEQQVETELQDEVQTEGQQEIICQEGVQTGAEEVEQIDNQLDVESSEQVKDIIENNEQNVEVQNDNVTYENDVIVDFDDAIVQENVIEF